MEVIQMFGVDGLAINEKIVTATRTIKTIIAKPTRACNADCSYCCAPKYDNNRWSVDTFKKFIDKLEPHLYESCDLLWHGGEPMLMGPKFYQEAYEYTKKLGINMQFSMQTNILKYNSKTWKKVLHDIFGGRISTSFDPDIKDRTVKGSAELYAKQFYTALQAMIDDGFDAFIIGVFDDSNIHMADEMYEWAKKYDGRISLRINYKNPVGRASQEEAQLLLDPITYGETLVRLDRKRKMDKAKIGLIPNDTLFSKLAGSNEQLCPWTSTCGGQIVSIEPNGDIYNCDNYAELEDPDQFAFGNLHRNSMHDILSSQAFKQIMSRSYTIHSDCLSCEYYHACQGGCSRDSYIHTGDTNGKFPYCASWKMILKEISGDL